MRTILPLFFVFYVCVGALHAQSFKSINKSLEKNSFIEAREKIEKRLDKESASVEALFAFGMYFRHANNRTFYNIDSAYWYFSLAEEAISSKEAKERKKLAKEGITRVVVQQQKRLMATKKFEEVASLNTEKHYHAYALFYQNEPEATIAQQRRDSIAYHIAKQQDTAEAYQQFFTKYPEASQAEEAQVRYHFRIYRNNTQENTPESYAAFIAKYPESPYRGSAEKNLFRSFMQKHSVERYKAFIHQYPNSSYLPQAKEALWYLAQQQDSLWATWRDGFFPKKERYTTKKEFTIPYYTFFNVKDKAYGFMSEQGNAYLAAQFDSVPSGYRCQALPTDVIVAFKDGKAGAFHRNGEQFIPYFYDDIVPFSPGVALVAKEGKYGLQHYSGFQMLPCEYAELKLLQNHWVRFRATEGTYGVLSFYGDTLVPPYFQEIYEGVGQLIITTMDDEQFGVLSLNDLDALPSSESGAQPFALYDDYEITPSNFLMVRKGNQYEVFDSNGNRLFAELFDEVWETYWGWVVQKENTYAIYNTAGKRISPLNYANVIAGRNEYGIKTGGKWGVLTPQGALLIQPVYDTLYFLGDAGIILEREGRKVGYFYTAEMIDFSEYENVSIQTVENEQGILKSFIVTTNRQGKKGVLRTDGTPVLRNRFEAINVKSQNAIIVEARGKKGLYNWKGERLTTLSYDGILNRGNTLFSLLRNQKFGVYISATRSIVEPQYDAILQPYGSTDSIFIAKNEKYGLINSKNEELTGFLFDALHFWSPTVLLGKKENRWYLYDFLNQRYLPEEIFDTFDFIRNDEEEIIIRTFKSTGFGLLSNQKGRIIADEYTGILNLGTPENPLYFLEKTVSKSNYYIILYVDKNGNVIKEQMLSLEDYEKISCQN